MESSDNRERYCDDRIYFHLSVGARRISVHLDWGFLVPNDEILCFVGDAILTHEYNCSTILADGGSSLRLRF